MVCSACRTAIPYGGTYYACSVSTCNRAATRLVFCSLGCWDSHVATLRHRDAGTIEQRAPARPEAGAAMVPAPAPAAAAAPAPRRVVVPVEPVAPAAPVDLQPADEDEVLVVVSKVKKYIRDRSGMNTADSAMPRLSDHIRALCDAAIRAAAQDGRKTVLERDLPSARR